MAIATDLFEAVRVAVEGVSDVKRAEVSRRRPPGSLGKASASIRYRGEEIERWGTQGVAARDDHTLPMAIVIYSPLDDAELLPILYAVVDAVSDMTKPAGVYSLLPAGIEEPEDQGEIASTQINFNAKFRRS